nr:Chain G, LP-46 [Human immunodeficiency virus 1]5YC0_H Chain H, LP-46 [Human immunodeficiency virus 1]5YC0_I Chain I, LP-46 [Human immunodeficiency virus 1]5YC0_P Chain P, LP-46 [Human immunodeficiency virus 1]5YC0_Q Chain Q, LP-46 [Human immunodeficiency virus 1]5YC0_W Chain W, LP-46 [Human immunodeficiency virus 1]
WQEWEQKITALLEQAQIQQEKNEYELQKLDK